MNACKLLAFALFLRDFVIKQFVRAANISVFLLEQIKNFIGLQLLAAIIAGFLHDCAEFALHCLWHFNSVIVCKNKCHSALAALRIYAHNRLVFSANIGRVNRQIRNFPIIGIALLHIHFAFVYGVLVRT